MTMAMTKTSDIRKTALDRFKKCLAEVSFASVLNIGIFCAVYMFILFIGRITGAHTDDSFLPYFSSFPPRFVISAAIVLVSVYVLIIPLHFGIRWFYWQVSVGNLMPVSSIFACYSSSEMIMRCIKLKLKVDIQRSLLMLFFGGLVAVEIILASWLWKYSGYNMAVGAVLIVGCTVMALGIMILCFVTSMRFIPVGYLLADNPDSQDAKIIKLSKSIVNKKYTYMLRLYISVLPAAVPCLLIFPILFVLPYLYMITAVFIHESLDGLNSSDDPEDEKESAEVGKEHALV